MPRSAATTDASPRFRTPSFWRIAATWWSTVRSESTSSACDLGVAHADCDEPQHLDLTGLARPARAGASTSPRPAREARVPRARAAAARRARPAAPAPSALSASSALAASLQLANPARKRGLVGAARDVPRALLPVPSLPRAETSPTASHSADGLVRRPRAGARTRARRRSTPALPFHRERGATPSPRSRRQRRRPGHAARRLGLGDGHRPPRGAGGRTFRRDPRAPRRAESLTSGSPRRARTRSRARSVRSAASAAAPAAAGGECRRPSPSPRPRASGLGRAAHERYTRSGRAARA